MAHPVGKAEAVWRERLIRFRDGGLTIKAFCEREGVSVSNFHAWKMRLGGNQANTSQQSAKDHDPSPPLFVPVRVAVGASAFSVRIDLPGGAVVQVPLEADERVLTCVIQAATRRCEEDSAC